ncbi:hypothetical protein FRC17_004958 [Serendipita sp. 399]|nr:hypothetical protein FRC17_004958 [Serendipita sp. 399]
MPHKQSKRSQPVPAPARPNPSNKTNKSSPSTPKNAKGPHGSPDSLSSASAYSGSSNGTPPYTDAYRSSKKLTKVIRGTGNGHGTKAKTKTRKVDDGPEAELSEDEDDMDLNDPNYDDVDDAITIEPSTLSAQPNLDMEELISTAKARFGESRNISRGYEMITSPSSRLVIPLDDTTAATSNTANFGHLESMVASISGFSDDSEWENIQFEMDGLDEVTSLPINGAKVGYADIVKGSL